jgi:hypothetical protein
VETKTPKSPHTIEELNRLYSEGETCDKELFSEQRSNILLSSGDHYTKKHAGWWNRIREAKSLSQEQKLRIVKNHTHKIVRTYINNIVSMAPGVVPTPVDKRDLQHIKSAELNKAVWDYAKQKHQLKMRIHGWAKDFIEIGEVFTKVYFDPNAGRFIGYEQEVDDEGNPVFETDENHQQIIDPQTGQPKPVASDRAAFSGDLCFKTILPANVIRAPEAKTIEESRFLAIRDMVPIPDLKKLVGDDEDKLKLITESQDETFFVFDNAKSSYSTTKNQVMVREFYFRPCVEYPQGWFAITTQNGILFEGSLPFGIYPLVYGGFDEVATTPRHRSIIKQLRPIQSEINRAASKMAETQITLGDDKVILQNGSKVTTGPHLPGIRTMFVTGQAPTTLPGRTGDQYLPYLESQVSELYAVANLAEDSELKPGTDPWANLFGSIRDKKKFSMYAEKFELFLVRVCETYLQLAKEYFDENMLIPAVGRSEYINIAEFKNQDALCVRVKVEPQTDDLNTIMGRTLQFNHILQYCSNQLDKDDIGKMIRMMPFANTDESFDDFTIDFDTATNIILALDRGEQVAPQQSDNAQYILKRLAARQKKPDFRMLAPQIQQAYAMLVKSYEGIIAQQAAELKAAQAQFIPSGGAMLKVDYYLKDPTNSARSVRATLPAESVDWLIKQLATQGSAQEQLMSQPPNIQADLSQMIANQGPAQRQLLPPGMPQPNQTVPGSPNWLAMQQQRPTNNIPGGIR